MLSKITRLLRSRSLSAPPFRRPPVPEHAGTARCSTTARAPAPAPTATRSLRVRQALNTTMAGSRPAIIPFNANRRNKRRALLRPQLAMPICFGHGEK